MLIFGVVQVPVCRQASTVAALLFASSLLVSSRIKNISVVFRKMRTAPTSYSFNFGVSSRRENTSLSLIIISHCQICKHLPSLSLCIITQLPFCKKPSHAHTRNLHTDKSTSIRTNVAMTVVTDSVYVQLFLRSTARSIPSTEFLSIATTFGESKQS